VGSNGASVDFWFPVFPIFQIKKGVKKHAALSPQRCTEAQDDRFSTTTTNCLGWARRKIERVCLTTKTALTGALNHVLGVGLPEALLAKIDGRCAK